MHNYRQGRRLQKHRNASLAPDKERNTYSGAIIWDLNAAPIWNAGVLDARDRYAFVMVTRYA